MCNKDSLIQWRVVDLKVSNSKDVIRLDVIRLDVIQSRFPFTFRCNVQQRKKILKVEFISHSEIKFTSSLEQ